MKTNKKTIYTHRVDKNGIKFTLAAIINENKGIAEASYVNLGLAICSKKDNFNRKLGRLISAGRAEKHPFDRKRIISKNVLDSTKKYLFKTADELAKDISKWTDGKPYKRITNK